MNTTINKIKIIFFLTLFAFTLNPSVNAQTLANPGETNFQVTFFQVNSGYSETSSSAGVSDIVARVIFTALSLLAVIFIILIIIAGYQWMTAGGNEEQVAKAKKNIANAVIGLIIILSAYAITWFIFTYLPMSAGTGSGGVSGVGSGG
jgi:hypothetical protein